MNLTTAVFLINKNLRAVLATYEDQPSSKKELFKTLDPTVKVGDICVVPSSTRHKFTTVKVTDADVSVDFDSQDQCRWIVARIDLGEHEKILKQEEEAVEAIKVADFNKRRKQMFDSLVDSADAANLKTLPLYVNGT